ncbi:MAG: polyprenyl diphosphate synthase [Patescibacteria group bacterium]|jgi:undecaprenyl diphosphate synthase
MIDNKLNIPLHVGIILDGNRRYAKANGLPRFEGHRRGLMNVKTIVKAAFSQGIKILTVYAFSTENWNREKVEIDYLMKLFKIFVNREVKTLVAQGVKINFFGRLTDYNAEIQADIKKIEAQTRRGLKGILNICLSYGGRDELVRAVKKIVNQEISVSEISESLIEKNLDSAGLPDPDLIIRTSGEQRLSGFLTWQSVYSELYFTKKYWPEFSKLDLIEAINEYSRRQRRYGAN